MMSKPSKSTVVALFLAVSPLATQAQTVSELPAGARVRISGLEVGERGERLYHIEGALAAADSTRLVLRVDGRDRPDTLPYFTMHRLDVQRGQIPRRKLVAGGLVTGLVTGTALWALTMIVPGPEKSSTTIIDDDGIPHITVERETGIRRFALVGFPVLGIAGLTAGSLMNTDVWVSVAIPGVGSRSR